MSTTTDQVGSTLPLRLRTTREVAEQLHVSTATVKRWVAAGLLPAMRVGKVLRYRPETLDAFSRVHEMRTDRLLEDLR